MMEDGYFTIDEASAFLDVGCFADARSVLTRIISRDAHLDRAHAYALRGWSWYQEQQFSLALADFDEALALEPEAENTLFLRARCREELNDPDGALADYQAVLRLNPSTPDAWDGAGLIHRYFGREQEADECAREADVVRSRLTSATSS